MEDFQSVMDRMSNYFVPIESSNLFKKIPKNYPPDTKFRYLNGSTPFDAIRFTQYAQTGGFQEIGQFEHYFLPIFASLV